MTKVRIFALVATFVFVSVVGYFVVLLARGYKFDTNDFTFNPNGILVVKSNPDGASIYIDGDLKGATNSNLRLSPKTYQVEVKKDGFLTWSKEITIKEEEVTQVTAELFKTAPSLSPITFTGVTNPVVSPDFSKVAYINDGDLWIMSVSTLPIGFSNEPKKVTEKIDVSSTYTFSPNARELLLETKTSAYLLNTSTFTAQVDRVNILSQKALILKQWDDEMEKINTPKIRLLPDKMIEVIRDGSVSFVFSPDDNMVMYTASKSTNIPDNLISQLPGSSTQNQERDIKVGKTYIYDIKEDRNFLISDNNSPLYWLPSSRHLIQADEEKIIIMDYDGTNKQTVFAGGYIAPHAYPFVNVSKLLILTNLGSDSTVTNLYSLSIK